MANWDEVVMSVKEELTNNECRILGQYCGLTSPDAQTATEAAFTLWQIDERVPPPQDICYLERIRERLDNAALLAAHDGELRRKCEDLAVQVRSRIDILKKGR